MFYVWEDVEDSLWKHTSQPNLVHSFVYEVTASLELFHHRFYKILWTSQGGKGDVLCNAIYTGDRLLMNQPERVNKLSKAIHVTDPKTSHPVCLGEGTYHESTSPHFGQSSHTNMLVIAIDNFLIDFVGNHADITFHRNFASEAAPTYDSMESVGLLCEFRSITRDFFVISDVTS